MKVTENTRSLILSGLRKNDISPSELARQMGLSKSWASRLLSGGIKTLSDDHVEKLQEILMIRFFVATETNPVTGTAKRLSDMSKHDPMLDALLIELAQYAEERNAPQQPRFYETQEMTKLGQEIIRICFADEKRPGKVARKVLNLISEGK